jgi:hypothetical protein
MIPEAKLQWPEIENPPGSFLAVPTGALVAAASGAGPFANTSSWTRRGPAGQHPDVLDQVPGCPCRGCASPGKPPDDLSIGFHAHAVAAHTLRSEDPEDAGVLQLFHGGVREAAQLLRFLGPFPQPGNQVVNTAEHLVVAGNGACRHQRYGPDVGPRKFQRMCGAVPLRRQIAVVGRREVHAGGNLFGNADAQGCQLRGLVRVVAEQPDARGAEGVQHLGSSSVIAFVLAVAQCQVRVVGIEASVLQGVGVELGIQTDAAALLPEVKQESACRRDLFDGLAQLRTAVAALAAEHVAGHAFAVQPDQRHVMCEELLFPLAQGEQQVLLAVREAAERQHLGRGAESVRKAQRHGHLAPHSSLVARGNLTAHGGGGQGRILRGGFNTCGHLRSSTFRVST